MGWLGAGEGGCTHGVVGQQDYGVAGLWGCGVMELECSGASGRQCYGGVGLWGCGFAGLGGYGGVGLWGYGVAGSQCCRTIGLGGCGVMVGGCWRVGHVPGAGGPQAAQVLCATGAVGMHEPQVQNQEAQLQELGGRGAAGPEGEHLHAKPCHAMLRRAQLLWGRTG